MIASLVMPFVACLVFTSLSRWAARHMTPRATAWVLTPTAVVLAVATTGSLALVAWPLVARIPVVAELGEWPTRAIVRGAPVATYWSVLALLLLAAVAVRSVRSTRRLWRAFVELRDAPRGLGSVSNPVVVVDDEFPNAHAAPGLTRGHGRTVISTGLLATLEPDEQRAVLAHEQAHLDHHHHLFGLVLDVVVGLNPLLARPAADARYALERWADEEAATATDRVTVAIALAKSALARIEGLRDGHAPYPIGMQLGGSRVSDRVAALLADRPRTLVQPAWWLSLWTPSVIAVVAALAASRDMEQVFDTLHRLH